MRLLPVLLLVGLVSGATAQVKTFTVVLSGLERTPPLVTNGFGQAMVNLDTGTSTVSVSGIYVNLTSAVSGVHIHGSARRGVDTGVIVPLTSTGGDSGAFFGNATLTAGQVQDLLSGMTYLNVHSMMHPGGEIRGQIDVVPGSGHSFAPSISVTGEAKPGGTLQVSCPAGIGTDFVVIGLALPPCQSIPLLIPEICFPGANVAIDLSVPPIVFPGSNVDIVLPVPFPAIDLTIQCATITSSNCVFLSPAHRIAIRP